MAHETLRRILEGLRWTPQVLTLEGICMALATAHLVNQINQEEYLMALLELNEAIEHND